MRVSLREGEVTMYIPDKPTPIEFYKEEGRDMMVEIVGNGAMHSQGQAQIILGDSSGEDHELKAPKKRAETWVHEETRCLISLRIEMDGLFNISKSNKHLWEQISSKMREKGFDRSPSMCTDKWRNLLKECKKTKHNERGVSAKMSYLKDLEELLKDRERYNKSAPCKSSTPPRVDPYIQFSEKGLEDADIAFGPAEASSRPTLNLERQTDHDGHSGVPLAITSADAITAGGVPPWNWRESGGDENSYGGRVISVEWGNFTRRIGIDATADAIKEAIKCAFGLRTRRAFWLEDEDKVIRSLDRNMPLGTYTLHRDEGITIKICFYDESERMPVPTEEKTFYTEDDFRDFLGLHRWVGLRELSGFRTVDTLDELRRGAMYQGVRMLGA